MTGSASNNNKVYWSIVLPLAVAKLLIHFVTNAVSGFGLHRDEYLYMAESDHLAWGYMEVPPMIAVIGKAAKIIFGHNEFAVRFFPAIIGALTIILLGIMIKDLGGKKWAQLVGCTGFLLSPVFLGSNNLFQPVSFNQFFWFLSAFILVKIVNREANRNLDKSSEEFLSPRFDSLWIALGILAGLGFLTKYSIIFFFIAMILAIMMSPYRRWFAQRYVYVALALALLIASPNLWWQYDHDFPVLGHMAELKSTQLVYVSTADFLIPQFLDHFACLLIWIPGLVFLLFSPRLRRYRFLGITYLLVLLIVWSLDGKDYYTFGAYTMLFAAGGVAWEHLIGRWTIGLVSTIALLNLPILPMAIPILPVDQMYIYSKFIKEDMGIVAPFRWEDDVVRNLKQDYADMLGWDEIPPKVANVYHNLPEELKSKCLIYGGSYGHAGVLNFYRKKYNLPEAYSFNASFVGWLKEDIDIEVQIQVDDNRQYESESFHKVTLMDSIEHPYARDPGWIYLKSNPKADLRPVWKNIVREQKREAGYK